MGKILKLLLGIIGSLIALLIIAAIAIPLFIDPNDFRDEINAQVSERTGRTLKIEGELGLSIFPWLGIDTGAIELGNAKGFGDSPFARIESSQIRVKLLPLLKKELEMDTLVLKGLNLNLQRRKNGQDNWSDLGGTAPAEEQPQDDQPTLAALAIGGVKLENARIHFDDRQVDKQFTTSALNLTTGSLQPGAPVPLKLRGDINSSAPAMNGHIELTTTLQANPFAGSYALEGMQLAVDLKGKDLPGGQLQARVGADISADLIKQSLAVNSLALDSGPLQVNGNVQLARFNSADPGVQGSLRIAPFKPRELFSALGMTASLTADPKALHQASLETRLAGSVQHLQLNDLQLVLDDSLLSGKLALRSGKQTLVSYDLKVDGINVDRYLPPPAEQQGKGLGIISTAVAAPAQPLIPVELLRGFDMAGAVKVDKLIAAGLLFENADVAIKLTRGLLKLDPIQGRVYGGQYDGHISIDASRKQGNLPLLSANESLRNVQMGPVLKAVTGSDTLLGQGNVSARLTARGQDMPALRSSLNGNLAINLVDGALNGINVAHELRKAYAIYKGQPAPAKGDVQQTDFSELSATGKVVNGVVINRDLAMKSPLLRINGEGKIDLVREHIDYKLNTAVVGSLTGQGGLELKELKGVTVPIAIKGNLSDPSFSLDLGRILEQRLKKELEKKLQDKLQNSLLGKPKAAPTEPSSQQAPTQEERVKDLFKGLFR
jgi:AsmA protein